MIAPAFAIFALQAGGGDTVRSIPEVDLSRYAGLWYEIARFPNSFQRKCSGETTARYELLANGEVRVINTCVRKDGSLARAEGRARIARTDRPNSQLEVRFAPKFLSFIGAVWADYWILDLTDDYTAALVGTPDRRYLWVLSRTPVLADSTFERLVDTAAAQGFPVDRLVVR